MQGLKQSQINALTRLFNRRFPADAVYTLEQGRELALLSRSIGRQIGLLINRKGRVGMVLVGKPDSIYIPDLERSRAGQGRLRGLRLLHTHLSSDGLSQEDLMDMLFLRLDAVIALSVNPVGEPVQWQAARLLPQGEGGSPYRLDDLKPWNQTEASFAADAEALEEELARTGHAAQASGGKPRALLVSVSTQARVLQERNLDELESLARTAGLTVAGRMVNRTSRINPKFILGRGKAAELEVSALQGHADMLVFDGELSPPQLHNLADITERKVIDRTQLILDIFAQHAVTKAGKLQVELAQLRYTQPRLVGKNRAMDRLMGGIGGRGPGETKLETDRRRNRERMAHIRKELERLRRQRALVRSHRSENGIPLAALVGYTNAGKSTLLNALTRSSVFVADKLFATLDPTTRRLRFPAEREIILADTVGFIRNLPRELVDAFRATLEELEAADMFLHVADAAHPDLLQQIQSVEGILEELSLGGVPRILLLNKWDQLSVAARAELADMFPRALPVAGKTGEGLRGLLALLENNLLAPENSSGAQCLCRPSRLETMGPSEIGDALV